MCSNCIISIILRIITGCEQSLLSADFKIIFSMSFLPQTRPTEPFCFTSVAKGSIFSSGYQHLWKNLKIHFVIGEIVTYRVAIGCPCLPCWQPQMSESNRKCPKSLQKTDMQGFTNEECKGSRLIYAMFIFPR